ARPGWMISRTPAKPMPTAVQRRQPTGSPRNSAAPSVTASGVACRIADALDRLVSTSAATNVTEPMTSPRLRSTISRENASRDSTGLPLTSDSVLKISAPPQPTSASTWPIGSADAICLISTSSIAKPAIEATISRLPRRLSITLPFGGYRKTERGGEGYSPKFVPGTLFPEIRARHDLYCGRRRRPGEAHENDKERTEGAIRIRPRRVRRRGRRAAGRLATDHRGAAARTGAGRLAQLPPHVRRHRIQPADADQSRHRRRPSRRLGLFYARQQPLGRDADRRERPD